MMSIIKNNNMFSDTEKMYFSKEFVDLVEDHAAYLNGLTSTTILLVAPGDTYKYRTDLFTYLKSKQIPSKLWVPIIAMNKIRDPQNFNEEWAGKNLRVPNASAIDVLIAKHKRK